MLWIAAMRRIAFACSAGAAAASLLLFAPLAFAQASFELLPFTDHFTEIESLGSLSVSGDGETVLGWQREYLSANGRFQYVPVRWDDGIGVTSLLPAAGDASSGTGYAISADGDSVVGHFERASGPSALRLQSGEGPTVVAPDAFARALDVSGDGTFVVGGRSTGVFGTWAEDGFLWDATNGTRSFSDLTGVTDPIAPNAISDDGRRVVGAYRPEDVQPEGGPSNFGRAFSWTETQGFSALGVLPGGLLESRALGLSGDGETAVGFAVVNPARLVAVRWDESGEAFRIPDGVTSIELDGIERSGTFASEFALAASGDGAEIVGTGRAGARRVAWLHDRVTGSTQDLRTLLIGLGLSGLEEWELTEAVDISADGRVITGWAQIRSDLPRPRFPRRGPPFPTTGDRYAFRAVLPEPSTALLVGLGLVGLAARTRRD